MTPKPRYMIVCREFKREGARRDQYVLASQDTYHDLDDAVHFAEGIASGRDARVLAVVWPEEEHDIFVNSEGREFFYLGQTSRKGEGDLVWLLDENDKRIGMTKAAFEREMRRREADDAPTP